MGCSKEANVASTALLLRLSISQSIQFVYVTGGQTSVYDDGHEAAIAAQLSAEGVIGYTQTKFVSEALVRRVAAQSSNRSSAIWVISPGLVVGTASEGVANADDYFWRLAAACITAGAFDGDTADEWFDVADVATVASTIVEAAFSPPASTRHRRGIVRQVQGRIQWRQFWEILSSMGYKIVPRTTQEWLSIVRSDIEQAQETHPLWPVAHFIFEGYFSRDFGGSSAGHNTQNGQAYNMNGPSEKCGSTDVSMLAKSLQRSARFLAENGHLPMPEEDSRGSSSVGGEQRDSASVCLRTGV